MEETIICIKCGHAIFFNPRKEICHKTGGLAKGRRRKEKNELTSSAPPRDIM